MFGRFWKDDEPTAVESQIAATLQEMDNFDVTSEDYQKRLAVVERLNKLQSTTSSSKVSPDTIAIVAGNLLGIVIVLSYENSHVIVTKAWNNIIKPR